MQFQRVKHDGSSNVPNCNKLTANEVTDSNNNDISRVSCGNLCNSIDDNVQYISVDGDNCYCYKQLPTGQIHIKHPQLQVVLLANVLQSGNNASLEILDEGRSLQMAKYPYSGSNSDQGREDMCKSYLLLEKSLTGQDVQNISVYHRFNQWFGYNGYIYKTGNQNAGMVED